MRTTAQFAALAERVAPGWRFHAARRLTGGVSADVHALELEGPRGEHRAVVVREHGRAGWKAQHEAVTVREYALLERLHAAGLPVPEPLLLDTSRRLLPGPFLVIAFVDGSPALAAEYLDASLEAMATALRRLHSMPTGDLPELPPRNDPLPELFDYLPEGTEWRRLREHLGRWGDSAYRDRPALLHGDFWPGNLLWREGRLVAILDWEDAALGDPLSDVACCRLELIHEYGLAAAEGFTRAYGRDRLLDARRLALWDVYVAAAASHFMGEWGLNPAREAVMRGNAEAFIRQAVDRLLGSTAPR